MVDLNEKLWKNKIEYSDELMNEWYSDFNKVIEGRKVYEYWDIYINTIGGSLVDICKKANVIVDEKQYNQYIHPKNKNNSKLLNSILWFYILMDVQ